MLRAELRKMLRCCSEAVRVFLEELEGGLDVGAIRGGLVLARVGRGDGGGHAVHRRVVGSLRRKRNDTE